MQIKSKQVEVSPEWMEVPAIDSLSENGIPL